MDAISIIAISLLVLYCIWMSWEIYTAPLMPDDYGLTEEEEKIWKEIEKENKNKQNEKNQ
jgi:nitrate/nitrite transporter NarK